MNTLDSIDGASTSAIANFNRDSTVVSSINFTIDRLINVRHQFSATMQNQGILLNQVDMASKAGIEKNLDIGAQYENLAVVHKLRDQVKQTLDLLELALRTNRRVGQHILESPQYRNRKAYERRLQAQVKPLTVSDTKCAKVAKIAKTKSTKSAKNLRGFLKPKSQISLSSPPPLESLALIL